MEIRITLFDRICGVICLTIVAAVMSFQEEIANFLRVKASVILPALNLLIILGLIFVVRVRGRWRR